MNRLWQILPGLWIGLCETDDRRGLVLMWRRD